MHKMWLNQATLGLQLRPQGPVLIKSGREAGADPTLLDMNFVRTFHAGLGRETVYLPGSSLKGTLRSYCERIARTVGVSCCDLFGESFCGKKWDRQDKKPTTATRYHDSCTICRLFGSTALASHISIADAYPTADTAQGANRTEERDGVAIDRVSGAAAGRALFTLEVVTRGLFEGKITLANFQFWQLGLLGLCLRDIHSGLVPVGFGKSRGLGRMAVLLSGGEIDYPGRLALEDDPLDFGDHLYSVGCPVFTPQVLDEYGFQTEGPLALDGLQFKILEAGESGRVRLAFEGKSLWEILQRTVPSWAAYAKAQREKTPQAGGG